MHGKNYENYEKKALRLFEEKLSIKTKECGLFVSLVYPYLGSSPDAIVDDSAVVEIKFSYSGQNEIMKPGAHFGYLMYGDNGNIVLKKSCIVPLLVVIVTQPHCLATAMTHQVQLKLHVL